MLRHPAQSLFLGTFPMGLATLVNMTVFVCVPAWGGGALKLVRAVRPMIMQVKTLIGLGLGIVVDWRCYIRLDMLLSPLCDVSSSVGLPVPISY